MATRKKAEAKPKAAVLNLEELITVNEAAALRRVTQGAIRDLMRRGKLRQERLFGRALVYRIEVTSFQPKTGRPPKSRSNSEL